MKEKKWIIIVICLIIAASVFSYFFYSVKVKKTAASVTTSHQHGSAAAPRAGKGSMSSMPGMNMENSAEQASSGEEMPTVEIPEDKQKMINLTTAKAEIKPMSKIIRTVGRIEYDERKLATANTKVEGWIEKLYVNYAGQYVKKGQPLAKIYSPELVAAQQELINIQQWASKGKEAKNEQTAQMLNKDAESILDATRKRLRLLDISDAQINQIEKTGKPVRNLTIYSPVSGYVVQKMALQGMRVMPGEKLFDVADLSTLWIVSDIYEYELPLIKVGQTARISLSYFPGREFTSRIDYINPSLAGETRTAKARFTIPNPGGQLKPQMFTNVEIKINLGSRLAVPAAAVIDTGVRQIVYVDKGEGNFEPREVMPGLRTEDQVEILKGLKAGEKVVASANFLIDSEAQLKGVQAMPGGHRH